ncbi:MAG TPA: hypothetical protein VFP50_15400 [Anaeromyxobacteraceae bacterium]|nr:hypothetical protein [Anaeromyxobacteraceae bacterium]
MSFSVVPAPCTVWGWLTERVGLTPTANARAIAAVDASGRVRGMVLYDGWTENSVEAHMAVDTPSAWRALLRPAFAYPFIQCQRGVIVGRIRESNTTSLRMATRLGFEVLARVRDGARVGEDLVLVQMRREDCPWLEPSARGARQRRESVPTMEPLESRSA